MTGGGTSPDEGEAGDACGPIEPLDTDRTPLQVSSREKARYLYCSFPRAWIEAPMSPRRRIDGLAALGGRVAPLANLVLGRPLARWGLERVFGLARRRTLPTFAFRSFLRRARRRGLTRRPTAGPAVAYFVDTYANTFDPSVAEAAVAVLRHNGIPVYVPGRQCGSGAPALAQEWEWICQASVGVVGADLALVAPVSAVAWARA